MPHFIELEEAITFQTGDAFWRKIAIPTSSITRIIDCSNSDHIENLAGFTPDFPASLIYTTSNYFIAKIHFQDLISLLNSPPTFAKYGDRINPQATNNIIGRIYTLPHIGPVTVREVLADDTVIWTSRKTLTSGSTELAVFEAIATPELPTIPQ